MKTCNLLVCLDFSDYCDAISALSTFITLILAYIIYKEYAKQQLLSKQIEAVYNLIASLHNDSVSLTFSNNGKGELVLNVFEISAIYKNKNSELLKHDELTIYFNQNHHAKSINNRLQQSK